MIDPKVVELAPFDRIPHMLLPVVTDMKQAANALKWAVDEMERRYQLFADAGTKNIATYNALGRAGRARRGEEPERRASSSPRTTTACRRRVPPDEGQRRGRRAAAGEAAVDRHRGRRVRRPDDAAGQGGRGRASRAWRRRRAPPGCTSILATQRPSVDVITGMIKANFPTRIAYRVAQKVDSRHHPRRAGRRAPARHGRHAHQAERDQRDQARAVPVGERGGGAARDRLPAPAGRAGLRREHPQAARRRRGARPTRTTPSRTPCTTTPCASSPTRGAARPRGSSASSALGYNRAARIVETMERRGLVGPANGAKDREVLIDPI